MSYLICHMKKFHKTEISPIEREVERDENYKSRNPQIDSSRTKDNYHIIKRDMSYIEYINARIESCNMKTTPRKDAVLMNSFVIGSDAKFFQNIPRERQREFFADCVRFFANKYGEENIVFAVVHMDTTTPHLRLAIVPIVNGRLCSAALYDPKKLSALQTELHAAVGVKYGLERGQEGSQMKHLDTAHYKAKLIIEQAEKNAAMIEEQGKRNAEIIIEQALKEVYEKGFEEGCEKEYKNCVIELSEKLQKLLDMERYAPEETEQVYHLVLQRKEQGLATKKGG